MGLGSERPAGGAPAGSRIRAPGEGVGVKPPKAESFSAFGRLT